MAQHTSGLNYHFYWMTFVLVSVLVVGYYLLMLGESRREFERVVRERFETGGHTRG